MTNRRWMSAAAAVLVGVGAGLVPGNATAQRPEDWPASLTLVTASPGGTYAVYGQGVASLIGDIVKVPTTTRQTEGPAQNLELIQSGRVELGMTTLGPASEAWTGDLARSPGLRHRNVRALFPMYETPFQIVALRHEAGPNITSVRDLDGRTVGVGPAAGTAGTYYPRWFKQLGLEIRARNGTAADQAEQVEQGGLDAFAFAAGLPVAAFSGLERRAAVTVFSFAPNEIARIKATSPYVTDFTIPAGTYRNLTEPLPTVAMWNMFVGHKDLPDGLAYAIVKAVFENHDRLVQAHPAARATLAENIHHNTVMWVHPGAIRYYREIGLTIPPEAVPPES